MTQKTGDTGDSTSIKYKVEPDKVHSLGVTLAQLI